MTSRGPARTSARRSRPLLLAALAVLGTVLAGVLAYQSLASSSLPEPPVPAPFRGAPGADAPGGDAPRGERAAAVGEADGIVPDGVTVFDDAYPAVAKLDDDLLGALRRAAADAADDGVELFVTTGWRSPAYQRQLLREAVARYGSEQEAARWVATPETSAHVSGDAIDVGPSGAAAWLSERGARYGLCQIYGNEPWHFELRPDAVDGGCPAMYADAAHDPRMRR